MDCSEELQQLKNNYRCLLSSETAVLSQVLNMMLPASLVPL
jgi:hypothetical protein